MVLGDVHFLSISWQFVSV